MNYRIIINQAKESLLFAFRSLRVNKLRTFLSLIGITIGIFAIISVLTVVSSLEKNLRDGINALGDDIVYVQKWPWGGGGEYPWWKYLKRPIPNIREYEYLKKNLSGLHDAAFMLSTGVQLKHKQNAADGAGALAVSEGYDNIRSFEIEAGRYISPYEFKAGKRVVVIGAEIANKLFKEEDPIGKEIVIKGYKMTIVGVFKKEGNSIIDTSLDNAALITVNFARSVFNVRSEGLNPLIMLKPAEGVTIEELMSEAKLLMRTYRRIKPREEDDFALNRISLISSSLDGIFSVLDLVGWVIGGFSVIVGGFGIANIMFVSVREQTRIIGIQKSLGAKNYFVLLQFLYEAVLLSLIGGLVGLLLVYLLTVVANSMMDFLFVLDAANIIIGISISVVIGVVSGFIPAMQASRLDPVVAISQN